MPLFYLEDNLTVQNTVLSRFTTHGLYQLREGTRNALVERGLVREITTLELDAYTSYFDWIPEYDTIIAELGCKTLGDFAGLNPALLDNDLQAKQAEVIQFLNPDRPAAIPKRDCCG